MKVVLYARVSTDDKGQTPETQMDIIRRIAQERGYEIVGEYIDYASGKDANRPKWKEIMYLASTKQIDGIMALRVDRIMRSVLHLSNTIEQLTAYNVQLIFSDMTFDPSNPNSELVINMLSAIAQWERQMISARTREGLQHRKSKGVKLGKKRRDDVPITTVAKLRIEGQSWNAIARMVNIPRTTLNDRREDIESEIRRLTDNGHTDGQSTDKGGYENTPLGIYTAPQGEHLSVTERYSSTEQEDF